MAIILEDYEYDIISKFNNDITQYYKNVSQLFSEYSGNSDSRKKIKILCDKNPYLKKYGRLRKDTKLDKFNKYRAIVLDLLNHQYTK
jgi:hypothetical protein